jgi:sigma-B regulation protein RsbU (phosphoserine phosphatase)
LPNDELGIAVADVAGKGLGAALLAANLQATLGAEARRAPSDLVSVIASVNHRFHEASFEECYATLFYATFDPASRILKYVNAGHNPPLLTRADGSIEWLETGGAPVGAVPLLAIRRGFTPAESRRRAGSLYGRDRRGARRFR